MAFGKKVIAAGLVVAGVAFLGIPFVTGIGLAMLSSDSGCTVASTSLATSVEATDDDSLSSLASSEVITSDALPAQTIEYLDAQNIKELAKTNMARYLAAEATEKVPWYVMAALHYREARMDPSRSISNGAELGTGVNVDGVTVVSDPSEDAINMARHFKRMAEYVYGIDVVDDQMTTEKWGQAFLAYNRGFLYKNKDRTYDLSPYVMNGFDSTHMNMRWIDADTVRGVDGNKAGALTLMVYLGGDVSSQACSTASGSIVPPVSGTGLAISSPYDPARYLPQERVTRPHLGTDIVGGDKTIVAMMGGEVEWAFNNSGWGYAVKIDHGNGTHTLYGHMVPGSLLVQKGERVIPGQPLGTMGNSGRSYGVHLHLEVWVADKRVDPEQFLIENGINLPHQ